MLSFVVPSRAFSGFECADASAEDLSPFSKGTESGGTTEGCLNLGLETEAGSAVCDSGWEHPVYPAMLPPFCFVSCQEKLLKPVCWQSSSRAKQSKIGAALGAGPATGPNTVQKEQDRTTGKGSVAAVVSSPCQKIEVLAR